MAIDPKTDLTLDELKTIIHGLRMSTLSFVEEKALNEINAMIKVLPLPEEIDRANAVPSSIKSLQRDIGNIMRLIELYGKRDVEFKTRYKSRTNLPPRYKVMDWRVPMKQEARSFTRELLKTSSVMEDLGYGKISGQLIKCAKNTLDNKFSTVDLVSVTADTLEQIGLIKEASDIRKIAQTYDMTMDDVTSGINQLNQVIDGVITSLQNKSQQLLHIPTAKNVVSMIGKLWGQLVQFKQSIQQPTQQIQQMAPQISQAMEEALPQSVFDPATKKSLKIEWTQADAQGEQTAYVTKADGKQYEVQSLPDGRLITKDTPMQQAATQPAQPAQPEQSASQGQVQPGAQETTTLQYKPGTKVYYQSRDGVESVGTITKVNPNGSLIINMETGDAGTKTNVNPKNVKLIDDETYEQYKAASTKFNLKMYKLAHKAN